MSQPEEFPEELGKFENPVSDGRFVMITAPRKRSQFDEHDQPPLVRHPIMDKTGILPAMGQPGSAADRFTSHWRHCADVGTRIRPMAAHEKSASGLLETVIERREDGGLFVKISINNSGNEDDLLAEILLEMRRLRSAYEILDPKFDHAQELPDHEGVLI